MGALFAPRRSFFVGGAYVRGPDGEHTMAGQMYVCTRTVPESATLPIVLMHGAASTGTTFETTPDGRPGMADLFLRGNRSVYIVDQPSRGRSRYSAELDGGLTHYTAEHMERMFTATADFRLWPQAALHSRWPGSGRIGDPIFDAFYAGQVGHVGSFERSEDLLRAAGAALLDEIGPAVLLTHSQSGRLGWHIADQRPDLVRALVAIEPNGPPFFERGDSDADDPVRPFGLTSRPLDYQPALPSGETLPRQRRRGVLDGMPDWVQPGPARQLVQLRRVPTLVVTGEASYHAQYDHLTVDFLRSAGVGVDHLELGRCGISGNGHLLPMESNNDEIVEVIENWLREQST